MDQASGKTISESPNAFRLPSAPNSNSGVNLSISSTARSIACRWKKSGCPRQHQRQRVLSRRYPRRAQLRLEAERRARFNSPYDWNSKRKSELTKAGSLVVGTRESGPEIQSWNGGLTGLRGLPDRVPGCAILPGASTGELSLIRPLPALLMLAALAMASARAG